MNEGRLVARARRGDPSAWVALVGEHQQAVFRLAYLMLGDADDAEDVAQDAFVRAYRALGTFDTDRPLRPWLLGIAANLARNRQRAAGRYRAALERFFGADRRVAAGDATTSVTETVAARDEARLLWQAVRRLEPPDQEVLYLRYFLELSESETASSLGVAPGTVKSRSHRALIRLREVVGREFPALSEGGKA